MLKQICLTALALCATAALLCRAEDAEYPFGTVFLKGGAIVPVDMTMVESKNEHLNFCFAHRYSDNTIRLSHSAGIHTVTEYGCTDISLDNGKTWQHSKGYIVNGFNAFEMKDGTKAAIGCWTYKELSEHTIDVHVEGKDGKTTTRKTTLKLPFVSRCQIHRNVVRCRDGRLIVPVKGSDKGKDGKWLAFMIESRDDGATWQYVSTILSASEVKRKCQEGPNEAELIELANGDILAYVRVDGLAPLQQLRSRDGGKTWGELQEIAPFGVAPAATLLQNGTLLVVTGRPGTYLLVDFTGTGESYEKYLVYGGSGSSYASVLEIEPNRVMVIYDESDFGSWRNQNRMARITALTLDVLKGASLNVDTSKTMGYEVFYSPDYAKGKLPDPKFGFRISGYNRDAGNTLKIVNVAERPEPVVRFEHRGTDGNAKFPYVLVQTIGEDATRIHGEVQVRLNDQSPNTPQFQFRAALPAKEGKPGSLYVSFKFANTFIRADSHGNPSLKAPFEFKNAFHTFLFEADTDSMTYKLFEKGQDKPLVTGPLGYHAQIPVGFQLGDGATDVVGCADLAYFGFTAGQ